VQSGMGPCMATSLSPKSTKGWGRFQ
jgi:hypothetical protein